MTSCEMFTLAFSGSSDDSVEPVLFVTRSVGISLCERPLFVCSLDCALGSSMGWCFLPSLFIFVDFWVDSIRTGGEFVNVLYNSAKKNHLYNFILKKFFQKNSLPSSSEFETVGCPTRIVLSSKFSDPDMYMKQLKSYVSFVKCKMSMLSIKLHKSLTTVRDIVGIFKCRKFLRHLNALIFNSWERKKKHYNWVQKLVGDSITVIFRISYRINWIILQIKQKQWWYVLKNIIRKFGYAAVGQIQCL